MQITIFFLSSIIFILVFICLIFFLYDVSEKLIPEITHRQKGGFIALVLGYPIWAISLLCNEVIKEAIPVQILAVIIFLLPPIDSIALGWLLEKLIQKSFKSKYYVNRFPLFLILLWLSIFVLTLLVMINIEYNHQIEETFTLTMGMFLASLFFSGKVISKYNDKIEKKVK